MREVIKVALASSNTQGALSGRYELNRHVQDPFILMEQGYPYDNVTALLSEY